MKRGAAVAAFCALALAPAAFAQQPGSGTPPPKPVNTLKELHQAFAACFKWPPRGESRTGMEITIRFSLTSRGEILGEPRFTFSTPEVKSEVRALYQRAMAEALKICVPFPLTPSFGEAVAGRPQTLRFVDTRGQRKA